MLVGRNFADVQVSRDPWNTRV